ncbi:MAG TPA: amino acid adenylation domain-containing protein, partial [Polyangiaceae bacterium]|nr:amino acid adenylation domain-containing protein [Polyangiaceae bacterium]
LRTTFTFGAAGDAEICIHEEPRIALKEKSWSAAEGDFGAWVTRQAVADAQSPFELGTGPLSRATLLSRGAREHVLLFTIHHAVWDGWSAGVLGQELVSLYGALSAGKPSPLAKLETQYADYAAWQRQRLQGEVLEQKVAFWKSELADAPAAIDLPTDRPRPRIQSYAGKTLFTKLGSPLSARVDACAKELGRTPFAVLFAAYAVLLARHSGQRDLVIATPTANRPHSELEALIGCFVNTLALRVELGRDLKFIELVHRVSERLLRTAPHQDLPFEKLVEALAVERDMSRSPVAQTMFVLQGTPRSALRVGELTFTPIDVDAGFAKLDLTLNVCPSGQGYEAAWEYNTDLFDDETALRMSAQYERLLESFVGSPNSEVWRAALLSEAEQNQLLYDRNRTNLEVPSESTLHELVLARARGAPDARALVVGSAAWTYGELLGRAESVASELSRRGARVGDLVAVFLRRDEHLVPALLGVLLVGAAYVPLDPAYPEDRIGLILEDTNAKLIVTTGELRERIGGEFQDRVLDVTLLPARPEESAPLAVGGQAADIAYVIYTSGSTGRPKGVAIEHRNAVAFIAWALTVFQRSELEGVLAATSVCFDLSVFELFGTLSAGGTVILAENALALPELPARDEVTLINTVPSAIVELVRAEAIPRSVRTVNLAGEALPEETVVRLYQLPHVERVYNLYGPSETTTYSTYTLTTRGAWRPTIGRPIANTRVYVLDEHLAPVPLGVRGELYIAGAGVARGYVARPELTAERFLPDPFARRGRMYKTGDVVRWLPTGELEYLGRNDHQVKLRGFRVELGEIEATLRSLPHVESAVVVVREDRPGNKQLVGYVVAEATQALSVEGLRA